MRIIQSVQRYLLTAAILIFGIWTLALTTSLVLARRAPSKAIAVYPTAEALARAAEASVVSRVAGNRSRAQDYAQRSIRRSPANSRAAAVLAITAGNAGDADRAERLLHYSEAMSRRYIPTQLSLLELAVQNGKAAAALVHYDRAMRVSLESRMTLFPILVQASGNPDLLPQIARFVAVPNSWKSSFLDRLITESSNPDAIALLVSAAKLNPNDDVGNRQLTAAIAKLVASGSYAQAEKLFNSTCAKACRTTPLNGGFESKGQIPPFGWELIGDGVEITTSAGGNHVLEFSGWSGGPSVRQLLGLTAGSYTIRTRFNIPSPDSVITLTLGCAAAPGRENTVIATFSASASARQAFRFDIPAKCRYQWLTLSQAPRLDPDLEPAWVDDIEIARISKPAPEAATTR